jgi:hypothetical protein
MTRSLHIAADNIASLQLVFANFYIALGGEVGGGTTATYTASIEYPVGTLTQVKFSGSVSGTAAPGALLVSDAVSVAIPQYASFFVRNYRVHAAGSYAAPYTQKGSTLNSAAGDNCNWGSTSGVTDQTMSGTVVGRGVPYAAPPVAIIGPTSVKSALIIGDSRVYGVNVVPSTPTNPGVGELAPSFFYASVGHIASGLASDKAAYWAAANYPLSANLAQYCTAIVSNHSINDLLNGETSAQLVANQQTMMAAFSSKAYFPCTIAPRTTSTDSWATLGNQTAGSENAQRVTYNTAVRAGIAGATGYFEIADSGESSRNSGLWLVNGTANYATQDGVHESEAADLTLSVVLTPQIRAAFNPVAGNLLGLNAGTGLLEL